MNKYDKIYVPAEGRGQTDYYMDCQGDLVGLTELSGRLCLTLEELREMWRRAENNSGFPPNSIKVEENFKTYLTSKGIQL